MVRIFGVIYETLEKSRFRIIGLALLLLLFLAIGIGRLKIDKSISTFFPETDAETEFAMTHISTMERVVIAVDSGDFETLTNAAEEIAQALREKLADKVKISLYYDDEVVNATSEYVYTHLSQLLTEDDYEQINARLTLDSIEDRIKNIKQLLLSPGGSAISDFVGRDPLMFGMPILNKVANSTSQSSSITITDGYMTNRDGTKLLMFADLLNEDYNDIFCRAIKDVTDSVSSEYKVTCWGYGAPLVTKENSDRVNSDEKITMSIALTAIVILFLLVFRSVYSVVVLMLPVIFGATTAIATFGLWGRPLSIMSTGGGAAVLGIALGYSIHMLTHAQHTSDVKKLIAEMARPMTIGSLTTVGAFVALLFTKSRVLQDLGLLASVALIATLLFCLIFLPHMIKISGGKKTYAMDVLNKFASYDFSRHTSLIIAIVAVFAVCFFHFTDVRFNNDMSVLNYSGDTHLKESQTVISEILGIDPDSETAQFILVTESADSLPEMLDRACKVATSVGATEVQSISNYLLPTEKQRTIGAKEWGRINSHADEIKQMVESVAEKNGFKKDAFADFFKLIHTPPTLSAPSFEELHAMPLLADMITIAEGKALVPINISTPRERRDAIINCVGNISGVAVTDMGYYASKMSENMVDDFNYLLMISSIIVSLGLILSYKRAELFLMTITPMAVSWVIILGLMAIFDVEFNVVNIILSTFIFGVGDDYSIFIMDGLQQKYRTGKNDILSGHKTAIVLSALVAIIGLGAQTFGKHPAVHSLGLISIFGLTAVIITSLVVQPVLFRLFVVRPSEKYVPLTLSLLLSSIYINALVFCACILAQVIIAISTLIPSEKIRFDVSHYAVHYIVRFFTWLASFCGRHKPTFKVNDTDKSYVYVANHLSSLDIVSVISSCPKSVFVVKNWIVKSPLIGFVARRLGYFGLEAELTEEQKKRIRKYISWGYSVVVFPEGTRSSDGAVHRFHKGAFMLAAEMQIPVRVVVFYGNDKILGKQSGFLYMRAKTDVMLLDEEFVILADRVTEYTRHIQEVVRNKYAEMCEKHSNTDVYYKDLLKLLYAYRGSDLEQDVSRFIKSVDKQEVDVHVENCGVGISAYWVAMHHKDVDIDATDTDSEKIDIAKNIFMLRRLPKLSFRTR